MGKVCRINGINMNIIAVHSLQDDKDPMSGALAKALGVTMHEALMRLRCPGNGPFIIAVLADMGRVAGLVEKLNAAGFKTAVLSEPEIEKEAGALMARRFELRADTLHIEAGKDVLDVLHKDIGLIMRGMGTVSSSDTVAEKSRKFSLGTAMLSGGLKISKTVVTKNEVVTEERQGFVNIYTAGGLVIAFFEKALSFDSLGPNRKYSSLENINYFISQLRLLNAGALYDDRLLNKTNQSALLGPTLSPERHMAVATALLSKVLLGSTGAS